MESSPPRHVIGGQWLNADEHGHVKLRASEDARTRSRWFPPLESIGTETDLPKVEIGPRGVAYASTVVRVGAARFEPPYVLTYVDVDGVRVLAHSPGQVPLAPGTPVELVLARVGVNAVTDGGKTGEPPAELWSYTATPVAEGAEQ